MKWSFQIGSVFSIPIKVHITFLILLVFVALVGEDLHQSVFGVLFVILVFVCVVIHELSHSLVAIRFGHRVRSIILLPIGGMAQMDEIPEDPKQEILISLAGPLASIVISGILLVVLLVMDIPITFWSEDSLFEGNMALNLFWINLILAAFNIIPAFPMDGGRVLRGILGMFMEHMKATRIAVFVGQALAVVLFFTGILYNWWLALIAVFIYLGAEGEERIWAMRTALADAPVREVMLTDFVSFSPNDNLKAASEAFLHTLQGNFPVLFGKTLMGVLTREDIIQAIGEKRENERIAEVMNREFDVTTENTKLVTLYKEMSEKRISMMPVMRGDELVGIVTMEQIGRYHVLSSARSAR